ncbi:MAG: transglycosylase domain-containing protein, partial [Deltaproteobacteria bacterium]
RFSLRGTLAHETGAGDIALSLERIHVADLPPGWLGDRGIALPAGTLDGQFNGKRSPDGQLGGHGRLTVRDLSVAWARLDPGPVGPLEATFEGDLGWDPGERRLTVRAGRATLEGAELRAEGAVTLAGDRPIELTLDAPAVDLQKVVDALPLPLRPPAQAPRLEGTFSAAFALRGPLGDPEALEFEKATLGLAGLKQAARRDGARDFLREPFQYHPEELAGPPRVIEVGPRNPHFVSYASLPPWIPRAVVVSEDAGFFGHHGFDFDEIKASIVRDVETGEAVRGGSTITQQLVKNVFLSRKKTLSRKIREALVTLEVEATVPKWRILEVYLNTIEWGPDIYGLGEAAQRYFGVQANQLSPREAAFLATIIPAPRRFYQLYYEARKVTPHLNERIDRLLGKMHEYGILDDASYAEATQEPLEFRHGPRAHPAAGAEPSAGDVPERGLWDRLFGR